MSKLIVALVLASAVCAACDTAAATVTAASPTPTVRSSSSAGAAPSPPGSVVPATAVPPTAAPATPVRTNPPTPAPTAQPGPAVKAVPTRGSRGSTFVLQFSGFPTSPQGVDIVQTVTLPTGARLAAKTFLAKPDGTGFTTYTPLATDPAGQYVVQLQVAGGGVSSFAIITVD